MFPDEASAVKWFEDQVWPDGERYCGHCGSTRTRATKSGKLMPYWCSDCRSYFSVRTGTALDCSRLPLRKWAFAVYLVLTNLKSVSSMKLHRDLKVTQKTAWFMIHRIREAWAEDGGMHSGPVEVDETFFGGKRKNMSASRRKQFSGRGAAGKAIVVGAKDLETGLVTARVVGGTDKETLQGFVGEHVQSGATVYTDEARAYMGLPGYRHEAVNHSIGEYVREMAHTNGIESFWSMLKRAYHGTFHHISDKHLQRYINEIFGKHGIRNEDTIRQMQECVAGMVGKRLMYRELIA